MGRFAAIPVESTFRSNRKEEGQNADPVADQENENVPPPKRRFMPEVVETSIKSNRKPAIDVVPAPEAVPVSMPQESPPKESPTPRRRFVPELIESTRRSKKAGDTRPATLPTDKVSCSLPQSQFTQPELIVTSQTDLTPGVPNIYTRPKRKPRPHVALIPSENSPAVSSTNIHPLHILPLPPRRQGSMRPHPNTRRSTRQNSFQPELEAIPSEENSQEDSSGSEDEGTDGTPSLTESYGSSEDSMMRLQLARTRESCDDRFSGYLLALAAKAAEKQLREQALAAFPNESTYEIVEHFYDRELDHSDEESVEAVGLLVVDDPQLTELQRKPTEVGWHVKEMQEHQEKLNRQREEETNHKIAAEATKPTFKDPFWTNGMTSKNAAFARGQDPVDKQKEAELERMRSAASPPMLGGDLKFRMCPSPKATKFESDQKVDVQPFRSDSGGGLWGGYCVAEEVGEYLSPSLDKGPTLIQTPHIERADPFASAFATEIPGGARSPKNSGDHGGLRMLAGIDERLKAEVVRSKMEETLLEEFDDTFVTQVYNYLSLGYPALARPYDDELARISRIAADELRRDDKNKVSQGHIGLADHSAGTADQHCARWKALRIYILEWARQHPSMSNSAMGPQAWGVRARRDSWGI